MDQHEDESDDFDWEAEEVRRKEYKERREWLRKLWLATPTLEFFLEARSKYPEIDFDISLTAGIEWLFSNAKDLEDAGLDPSIRLVAISSG